MSACILFLSVFYFTRSENIIKKLTVALRTKRKIFSYKIQKPLLKRNLKKDA